MDQARFDILIDGQKTQATKGETFTVVNPANQTPIAEVPLSDEVDVDKAVQAAHRAFEEWSVTPARDRAKILHSAADNVRTHLDEIARLLTLEMGKPLIDAEKEIADGANVLDFFAEEILRRSGEIAPLGGPEATGLVIEEPLGVCVAIAPWNYPVSLLGWKIAPALAAGCTIVGKPASETPTAALRYIECIHEAGLPDGVLNTVTGPGEKVGGALVKHPLVRKIGFTGTDSVGKLLMAQGAETLKHITLELGGHSPFIVCADANFEKAVSEGVKRAFRNMGQICNAVNRIYVEESIYEAYLEAFVVETKKMSIGDGMDNPDLGPMLKQDGLDKAIEHIADAVGKGARLLYGGSKPQGDQYKNGFFYLPTVLADCTQDMLVMQEETFGPVAGIAPFKDLDEAIGLANDNRYGLVSYAYTTNLTSAKQLATGIKSGTVCINNVSGATLQAPYGGWKDSGMGTELSHYGLDAYLLRKHVRIEV